MNATLAAITLIASFNCGQASLPTEILICQDQEISALDDSNASIFYSVRGQLRPDQLHAFNEYERAWISYRNSCGYNRDCVINSYNEHYNYLCNRAVYPINGCEGDD